MCCLVRAVPNADHPMRPTGQGVYFNALLILHDIPAERMLNEAWWTLLSMLRQSRSLLADVYTKLLPWLVQKPLDQLPAATDEESHWLALPLTLPLTDKGTVLLANTLELLRYLLLTQIGRADVEAWFLQLQLHLLDKCADDLEFFSPAEGLVLPSAQIGVLRAIYQEMACIVVDSALETERLGSLLRSITKLKESLLKHENAQRPDAPATPWLGPARFGDEHLHWGFERFVPRGPHVIAKLAGESTFDKDMVGIKPVDFLHGNVLGGAGSGAVQDLSGTQQRRVVSSSAALAADGALSLPACISKLQRCLQLCLQLSNLNDVTWRYHLINALLADTFLRQLPVPNHRTRCVWSAPASGLDATGEYGLFSTCLVTLSTLMELLATATAAAGLSQDDAATWHPSLVIISGVMAAITDAMARRPVILRIHLETAADATGRGSRGNPGTTQGNGATERAAELPRLSVLLCGRLGRLDGEDSTLGTGSSIYGIGVSSFEKSSSTFNLMSPQLALARTAVLDYFLALRIPPSNELFDVQAQAHYSGKGCATFRFFRHLALGVYSHSSNAITDTHLDLRDCGVENVAFRDVMLFWKFFQLCCDSGRPFGYGSSSFDSLINDEDGEASRGVRRLRLRFAQRVPEGSKMRYMIHFEGSRAVIFAPAHQDRDGQHAEGRTRRRQHSYESESEDEETLIPRRRMRAMGKLDQEGEDIFNSRLTIRLPMTTQTAPSWHTDTHAVESEEDILHLRHLPEFSGFLTQSDVELLLSYLTVPYLRIPLILEFFSDMSHIHALQDDGLRMLIERSLFEPGSFANDSFHAAPSHVPSPQPDAAAATRYGLLLNEMVHNSSWLLETMATLIERVCLFDTYTIEGKMSDAILFVARIAFRVEQAALLLLHAERLTLHDVRFLRPVRPEELLLKQQTLHTLLVRTLPDVLRTWLASADAGASPGDLQVQCNVHAHLVYLHSSMAVHEITLQTASTVLSSFLFCCARGFGAIPSHVLFEVMHRLRAPLVQYLEEGTRLRDEFDEVLSCAYAAATSGHVVKREPGDDDQRDNSGAVQAAQPAAAPPAGEWARFTERANLGRYVILLDESARQRHCRNVSPEVVTANVRSVNEEHSEGEERDAELNLQVWQVVASGAAVAPLPASVVERYSDDIRRSLGLPVRASVQDVRRHVTRYGILGRHARVDVWDSDAFHDRLKGVQSRSPPNASRPSRTRPRTRRHLLARSQCAHTLTPMRRYVGCAVLNKRVYNMFVRLVKGTGAKSDRMLDWTDEEKEMLATGGLVFQPEEARGDAQFSRKVDAYLEQKMFEHEKWAYRLMHQLTLANILPPKLVKEDQDDGGRRKGGHHMGGMLGRMFNSTFGMVTYYLPSVIDPDARVVPFIGTTRNVKYVNIKVQDEFKFFTYQEYLCPIVYEGYLFKHHDMVQMYKVCSVAREYHRMLVYTNRVEMTLTDPRAYDSAHHESERQSVPTDEDDMDPYDEIRAQVMGAREDSTQSELISADAFRRGTACITRAAQPVVSEEGDKRSASWGYAISATLSERYVAPQYLSGLLQTHLLKQYTFWLEAPSGGSASDGSSATTCMLRGYPNQAAKHVLLVHTQMKPLNAFADANDRVAATVHKHFLEGGQEDLLLLNILSSAPGNDLDTVCRVFNRLEQLSHILVWSTMREERQIAVDLVELPRLQLSFRRHASMAAPSHGPANDGDSGSAEPPGKISQVAMHGEQNPLVCVEVPHLHVYCPPGGKWPPAILQLVEDIPHGVMMMSENQQLVLLVPNLPIVGSGGRLEVDHELNSRTDRDRTASVSSLYFTYEVHISKQFLITTSLASALYLLAMRFLCEQYEEAFQLADAIATDRDFDAEEREIFNLLTNTKQFEASDPMGSLLRGDHNDDEDDLERMFGGRTNQKRNSKRSAQAGFSPDASACLCKIALAIEDSLIQLPVSLLRVAATYVVSVGRVSAKCRLTEAEELRLMQLIHEETLLHDAVHSVVKGYDREIVRRAAKFSTQKTHQQGSSPEAKLVLECHREIRMAAAEAGVSIFHEQIPALIDDVLEKGSKHNDHAEEQIICSNRRKQLALRARCRPHVSGVGESDETELCLPLQRSRQTGIAFRAHSLQNVVNVAPHEWSSLVIAYKQPARWDIDTVSSMLAKLIMDEGGDDLEGEGKHLGFLFLYQLLTCSANVQLPTLSGEPVDEHALATIAMLWFTDLLPRDETDDLGSKGQPARRRRRKGGLEKNGERVRFLLSSLVHILACNPSACRSESRPPPRLKKHDGFGDKVQWHVKHVQDMRLDEGAEETEITVEEDEKTPLFELLESLLDWVRRQHDSLKWPSWTATKLVFHVSDNVVERGLFQRRVSGTVITELSCEERSLQSASLDAMTPLLRALGLPFGANDLPMSISSQFALSSSSVSEFTESVHAPVKTYKTLGFALESHRLVTSHPLASTTVQRIQRDVELFSSHCNERVKPRLKAVSTSFEVSLNRIMVALTAGSPALGVIRDPSTEIGQARRQAIDATDSAAHSVGKLLEALRRTQTTEMEKVERAVLLLHRVSNHVEAPGLKASASDSELRRRLAFELLRLGSGEASIDFRFMVSSLLSPSLESDWRDVNPFISSANVSELKQLVATMLLHATTVSHVNELLFDCSRLEEQLRALRKIIVTIEHAGGDSATMRSFHVSTRAVVHLADQIAQALHVRRHYINQQDASYDPRFLVFEFIRSIILREGQVRIVRDFKRALDPKNLEHIVAEQERAIDNTHKNGGSVPNADYYCLAQQMLMGQGKTAVITPLLVLMMADGTRMPLILLPESLLAAGRNLISSTFSQLLVKRVYTLECSRASEAEPRYLNLMANALRYKGVVMTTPSAIKSVILKFVELLVALSDNAANASGGTGTTNPTNGKSADRGEAQRLTKRERTGLEAQTRVWARVLERFSKSLLIMDELDWITHPMRSELNFPIGAKVPLDFCEDGGHRWMLPLHLWDAIFSQERQIPPAHLHESKRAQAILWQLNAVVQRGNEPGVDALQRRPHMILLDEQFYHREMLPILAEWMMLHLQPLLSLNVQQHADSVRAHLTSPDGGSITVLGEAVVATFRPRDWQLVNLSHRLLHILLPHCLKKVNCVTFGLVAEADANAVVRDDPLATRSRLFLAVPFIGKDQPSAAAEFSQPDVTIGLTNLAYTLQGLRKMDLERVLEHLKRQFYRENGPAEQRLATKIYSSWIEKAGGEICGDAPRSRTTRERSLQLSTSCLYLDSRIAESSSGAYGESIWRDLSGQQLDVNVAPAVLSRIGGYYMTHAAPLIVPHGHALKTALAAEFTLTIVSQPIVLKQESDGASDDTLLLLLTLGDSLFITAKSSETITVSTEKVVLGHMQYPPGLVDATGAGVIVHQFTVSWQDVGLNDRMNAVSPNGSAGGSRVLKYYANGAFVQALRLPADLLISSSTHSDSLIIGAAQTARCSSYIFLVLAHTTCLSPAGMQAAAAELTAHPEEWGASRPGDGMLYGAALALELEAMRLVQMLVLYDSRELTHWLLHARLARQQRVDARPHRPLIATQAKVEEAIGSDFTCAAVIFCPGWRGFPLLSLYLDGLAQSLSGRLRGAPDYSDRPQSHAVTVTRHFSFGVEHTIKYYVDGVLAKQWPRVSLRNAPLAPDFFVRLQMGSLFGFVRDVQHPENVGRVLFFAMYHTALSAGVLHTMATALVEPAGGQARTRAWSWGTQPRLLINGKARGLSQRGYDLLLYCAAARQLNHDMPLTLPARPRKPRVEPLFLVRTGAADGYGTSTEPKAMYSTISQLVEDNEEIWYEAMKNVTGVQMDDDDDDFDEVSMPAAAVVEGLQMIGIRADADKVQAAAVELGRKIESLDDDGARTLAKDLKNATTTDRYNMDSTFNIAAYIRFTGGETARTDTANTITGVQGLHRLLHKSPAVIKYYLTEVIFPEFMSVQKQKISTSGVDLAGDLIFPARLGFSGTPSELLPASMGRCAFAETTQGEMVHTLSSPSIVKLVHIDSSAWSAKLLLDLIAMQDPCLEQPIHALIGPQSLAPTKPTFRVARGQLVC